ncbi:MAG: UDP-N-acetylmuramoyl-tripeptide--D-alanyl-D-alanine ligase [Lachnospiraceae bacterium]|nr:UDP-N-acetylmuramoyl-tripeptide--D-alanyl-D-alanine ligase [Lachnospiraceae bacterium]
MFEKIFFITSYLVLVLLQCFVFWYGMRYNVHMLQQNSYKNKGHMKWLKENFSRQRFLLIGTVPLVLTAVLGDHGVAVIISAAFGVLVAVGYVAQKRNNTKKKLVFTNRVKRLIVCDLVVNGILTAIPAVVFFLADGGKAALRAGTTALVLLNLLEPLCLVLCNILMKPVEKHINNGFIKDAKKILKENKDLIVIGVTGSYGKTSLKFFLKELLSVKFNVLATPESFNTPMGVVKTIRESLRQTDDIFICEMGAKHVGDIKEICDIVHPAHGVITSVGPQHLETFKTIENVRKTKFELAEALPAGGKLFVNFDSEEARKQEGNYNRIVYGIEDRTGCYAKDISLSPLGTDFTVVTPDGEEERFHMRLIGYVNVLNVLGAITVAHSFGIPLEELKVPVRRLIPVSHRLELREHGNFTIIDDAYNSNPVGSKAAVETLKDFDGVRILITPGMVELGEKEDELHYKFGTYAAPCCDYILLVNRYRTKEIKRGALESGFPEDRLFEFDKFTEAMDFACTRIKDDRHRFILLENDLPDNF